MKILFIATSLCFFAMAASAQDAPKPASNQHLEIGLYSEVGTFINPNFFYKNRSNITFNEGIAFRYRLSKNFKISTGLAFSVEKATSESFNAESYIVPEVNAHLRGKYTGYLLRLPLALQTNLWHNKFYAVSGIELYMPLRTKSIDKYREIATGREFETVSKNSSFMKDIDVQFLAALGWNFKAIKGNAFSIETTAKISFYGSFRAYYHNQFDIMPNVKLSWFFKK